MNEIILSSGRSQSRTMLKILQSEAYKKRLLAAGVTAEDMQYFAAKVSAAIANSTQAVQQLTRVSELIRSAGKDLNKSLLKVEYPEINPVNPYYRQHKNRSYK